MNMKFLAFLTIFACVNVVIAKEGKFCEEAVDHLKEVNEAIAELGSSTMDDLEKEKLRNLKNLLETLAQEEKCSLKD